MGSHFAARTMGVFGADGSSCSPSGRASVDVVVKIGGSACTIKSSFETLNEPALNAVCDSSLRLLMQV